MKFIAPINMIVHVIFESVILLRRGARDREPYEPANKQHGD